MVCRCQSFKKQMVSIPMSIRKNHKSDEKTPVVIGSVGRYVQIMGDSLEK